MRGFGTAQVVGDARAGELERSAAAGVGKLLRREHRLPYAVSRCFFLLRLYGF
jgi:hypothetical protein